MKQGASGPKPRIAGKGINISALAIWHEKMGISVDEIVREYNLTRAEIYAGLAYYHDHKAEIDAQILQEEAYVEEMKKGSESALSKRLMIVGVGFIVPACRCL